MQGTIKHYVGDVGPVHPNLWVDMWQVFVRLFNLYIMPLNDMREMRELMLEQIRNGEA